MGGRLRLASVSLVIASFGQSPVPGHFSYGVGHSPSLPLAQEHTGSCFFGHSHDVLTPSGLWMQ